MRRRPAQSVRSANLEQLSSELLDAVVRAWVQKVQPL